MELYGAVVTQARQPVFFARLGVADTPEGRTELVLVHLFLVMDRLLREGPEGEKIARMVGETFITDLDDNLREMGVGDLAVPPKVKRAAAALYERFQTYRGALSQKDDAALATVLANAVPGLSGNEAAAAAVARYVRAMDDKLAAAPYGDVAGGRVAFVLPEAPDGAPGSEESAR